MMQTMDGSRARRAFASMSRRTLVGLVVVGAVGTGLAVWQLRGTTSVTASVPTVTAVRGDVVVSVRALGKVVDARAASMGTTTGSGGAAAGGAATSTGGQSAPAVAGTSQLIFPQAAGRLTAFLVSPGQHVAAAQMLARLDPAIARNNAVSAQASLDQALAQLEIDRSGVTPQSLASTKAGVTIAVATLAGAGGALRHAVRVNRDLVAGAGQQVAQAKTQLAADVRALGPSPQSTVAAEATVKAARDGVAATGAALADARAVNAQQIATAEHAVDAARQELAVDQTKLQRDLATERRMCGTNSPIIATDTSNECVNAAATVTADQQAIVRDQGVVQSALDGLAQGRVNAAQNEHQALSQVAAATRSLKSAQDQLAALRKSNGQTVAKDRQALATARSALAQARSKAAESTGQMRTQVQTASVGLANAKAALVALEQGAPRPLIAQDQSKILAARAQVDAARSALAQTVVRALAGGTVTSVFVAPGSPVDVSTPIAAIADLSHLAVSLALSEFDVARVRPGMSAVVSVDALGGKRFPGRVVFEAISGVDNGGVVTFPIRVALDRVSGIRIGMNVSAQIVVARRRDVVKVPLEALARDGRGRAVVTVVGNAGRTSSRVVTVGLANNKDVEITRGLRTGERVELQPTQGP